MVTILPREQSLGETLGNAVSGVAKAGIEHYQHRSDEMALQKTIENLPKDASMRDTLEAVTNTKTYRNDRKNAFYDRVLKLNDIELNEKKSKADLELRKSKIEATNNATEVKRAGQAETIRHNKATESNTAAKTTTASDIAKGKYKSAELIATEKNVANAEKYAQDVKFKSEELTFEKQKAKDNLELAKKKLDNDIDALKKKNELAEASEKRKDTQGSEKLRQEAKDLERKIDEQKIKVDQFDRQFEMKNDHFNRNLQFEQLKHQELLDLRAQEADIKLQDVQGKLNQQEADLEEKKRQFDQEYDLSLNKDLRDQDKSQAELDKIKHQIEHDQNMLNETIRYRDEQQAIAREKNQIAWKELEKTNPTEFEKVRQHKAAEEYVELEKNLPKMYQTREDIKVAQDLAAKLGWGAPIKSLFGAEGPAKLEALSYKLLEPIIHVFNPTGVLGFKKLDQLRAIYHIKATDSPGTRKAKADALSHFNDQAIKNAEDRMKLIRQYNGAPPLNVIEKFDRDAESLVDAMIDYDLGAKEVNIPGLPKAGIDNKGKTITQKSTGKKFISDGARWTEK